MCRLVEDRNDDCDGWPGHVGAVLVRAGRFMLTTVLSVTFTPMTKAPDNRHRTLPRYWLAGVVALPLLIWWLGWHPGFASSDTIDQWTQGITGDYRNHHPPVHTLYLWVISTGGSRPGLVSLIQLLALTGLLVYAARWLVRAGVPTWVAVGATWLLGLSIAIAATTLTLWKDVVFGLFFLWAWIELLALAVDRSQWARTWPLARLGLALAGVWVFRGNGPITVILLVLVMAWSQRSHLRRMAIPVVVTAVAVFVVTVPLNAALGVTGPGIDPAQVFLPDVAASYVDEPETFTDADIDLLTAVAPLDVWVERYDCYDSTPLLFDPRFDHTPVRQTPGAYRGLVFSVFTRDLDTVVAHRVCAANFVYSPAQPSDSYFHRPPYDTPTNEVGLSRRPISDRAFAVTDRYWRWAEDHLWLTWRPAIIILPALGAVLLFVLAPERRRLLLPATLFLAHIVNVAATSPAQEFRYAYPLYLVAVLTIPLATTTSPDTPATAR